MNALNLLRACGLTVLFLAGPALALGAEASTPAPVPTPQLPHKALHGQIVVEVNKRGQVVRIKGGSLSHDSVFDTMMIGNSMQMWIRHPDGSAEVGLYRIDYAYDPSTHNVERRVALVSKGGTWGNDSGAATKMIKVAQREVEASRALLRAQEKKRSEEESKHLPDIRSIVKKAVVKPTSTPRPR